MADMKAVMKDTKIDVTTENQFFLIYIYKALCCVSVTFFVTVCSFVCSFVRSYVHSSEARLEVSVASQPTAGARIFGPVGP